MENIAIAELLSLVPLVALILSAFIYYQSVKERHYKDAAEEAEVSNKLTQLDDLIGKMDNIQKYLTNDKEALETHRTAINGLAKKQSRLRDVVASNSEGIYLCMQHEVKGNHTDLLEKWMRDSVKNNIIDENELLPRDDN